MTEGQKGIAMQKPVTADQVQDWIVRRLARILDVPPATIDVDERLQNYGLESVEAVTVSGDLSDWLGRKVPPTVLWDYPTIALMAKHIAANETAKETA